VAPIFVAVVIVALWWLVAHNGGSGWVQFLGDLVFGALCIGVLGPWLVVTRARLTVRGAPSDGVAGLPVDIRVDAGSRLRIRPVDPPGDEVFVGPARQKGAVDDRVTVVPVRRGVRDTVTVDIASAAPFALQWWTRRRQQPRTDMGLPRGARRYVPGDSRRIVHWRATAHAGKLMVRELEQPSAGPVTITVDLPDDPEEAERVAEGVLGTVAQLLDTGAPVLLGTLEPSGPVLAPVTDRLGAGRRLARAVARRADAAAP
jgi:uncharacterized protein (DUF58 family)